MLFISQSTIMPTTEDLLEQPFQSCNLTYFKKLTALGTLVETDLIWDTIKKAFNLKDGGAKGLGGL